MAFYGIDLHSDSQTAAKIKNGNRLHEIKTFHMPLKGEKFNFFLNQLTKEDIILIEATTQSFWFYDQVKDRVKACYILNSNKLDGPISNKTDKIDATRLVMLLVYYELMPISPEKKPYIYVPIPEVRELRGLFTSFNLQKKMITQAKNRIHSIYKQNGIKLDRKNLENIKRRNELLKEVKLPELWMFQVITMNKNLTMLEKEKKGIEELIIYKGHKLFKQDIERLISIKGFSPLIAVALMTDICDVDRFKNEKKFTCYLRTTPKVTSSNDTIKIGRTNKQARKLTVSLLAESASWIGKSCDHFIRFKERVGKGKKACVVRMALMRKALCAAYHMLIKKELFWGIDKKSYKVKLYNLHRLIKNYEKRLEKNCMSKNAA